MAGAKAHLFCSGERDELATSEVHRNWPGEDVPSSKLQKHGRGRHIACMAPAFNVCGTRYTRNLSVLMYTACTSLQACIYMYVSACVCTCVCMVMCL